MLIIFSIIVILFISLIVFGYNLGKTSADLDEIYDQLDLDGYTEG